MVKYEINLVTQMYIDISFGPQRPWYLGLCPLCPMVNLTMGLCIQNHFPMRNSKLKCAVYVQRNPIYLQYFLDLVVSFPVFDQIGA